MYGEGPLEDPQDVLSRAIKKAKPAVLLKVIEANQIQRAMIFCRTRLDCDHLEEYLKANLGAMGRDELCVTLHSDKSVEQRKQVVDNFKGDKVNFFICTDIAARGIDVSGLPFVISMPLPIPFTCFLQFILFHLFCYRLHSSRTRQRLRSQDWTRWQGRQNGVGCLSGWELQRTGLVSYLLQQGQELREHQAQGGRGLHHVEGREGPHFCESRCPCVCRNFSKNLVCDRKWKRPLEFQSISWIRIFGWWEERRRKTGSLFTARRGRSDLA